METPDVLLARLDERLKILADRMEESQDSQVRTRAWMSEVDRKLFDISSRLTSVETNFAKAAPTIDEYINMKNKILGAGTAGRWLWLGLGSLLGFMIAAKDFFIRIFFTGQP